MKTKYHWTKYLPELRLWIEFMPFFSLRTEAMYQRYESKTRSFLDVRVTLWKWKFHFDTYFREADFIN